MSGIVSGTVVRNIADTTKLLYQIKDLEAENAHLCQRVVDLETELAYAQGTIADQEAEIERLTETGLAFMDELAEAA